MGDRLVGTLDSSSDQDRGPEGDLKLVEDCGGPKHHAHAFDLSPVDCGSIEGIQWKEEHGHSGSVQTSAEEFGTIAVARICWEYFGGHWENLVDK